MAWILIAETDDDERGLAGMLVRAAGHHTVEVTSAAEAFDRLDRLDDDRFDLVLLGDGLAAPGCVETCRALRTHPRGMSVPVVFMTRSPDSILADMIAAGGDDIVTRPLYGLDLEHRIRLALAVNDARRGERTTSELLLRRCEELARSAAQKEALMEFLVHDLKSPLTSVAFTLQELLGRGVPDAYSVPLRSCLAATDNVGRMVMNLLDLSTARPLEARPVSCPIDGLFAHLADSFALRLEVRGVTLHTRAAITDLWADRELLRRVAENLLDNALRYTRGGTAIELDADADDDGGVLTVIDRGPGVPAPHRERIFDRFVQLDPSASQRASRGLGLAFCRLAVDAHGGRIAVDDAPGGGARFRAMFPGPVGRRC
ncbi:MAG TPA: ATP-binding protein [Kofleriaceae bacterium]|nr:ATP-binding protein [Kofleriaceae bacterium]